jgi:hypothetical protein
MRIEYHEDGQAGRWFQPGDVPGEFQALPTSFTVHIDDGSLPWNVSLTFTVDEASTAHKVTSWTVQERPGGRPASAALSHRHIPVATLRRRAIKAAMETWRISVDDPTRLELVWSDRLMFEEYAPEGRVVPSDDRAEAAMAGGRRNAVTAQMRAEALAMYEEARADPNVGDATKYVADQLGRGRSTIGDWLKQARRDREELT